jgi:hypothetical protein
MFQSISSEGLVTVLVHELFNIVLDILGSFMFSKIKLNHGAKLVTKLHQPHTTLELANFELSHEVG